MMSQEAFQQKAGFDLHSFVKRCKDEMGVGRVRVRMDNPSAQAMSRYDGEVLEIHLAELDAIMRQRPELTREEAVAKIKAATCEELAHGYYHETNHDENVVGATVGCMMRNMSPTELATPYIREKVARLQAAQSPVAGETL